MGLKKRERPITGRSLLFLGLEQINEFVHNTGDFILRGRGHSDRLHRAIGPLSIRPSPSWLWEVGFCILTETLTGCPIIGLCRFNLRIEVSQMQLFPIHLYSRNPPAHVQSS